MILKTRVFTLCVRNYKNLSELAKAMDISVSQVYRVLEGKRNINRKFIIGAMKAFPGYKFDDLFYFVTETTVVEKSAVQQLAERTNRQSVSMGKKS
jgi:predicted transcriptional regulator